MRFVSKGRIYNTHIYCGFLSDGVVYQEVRKPLCFAEFIGPTMEDNYDSSSDLYKLMSNFATGSSPQMLWVSFGTLSEQYLSNVLNFKIKSKNIQCKIIFQKICFMNTVGPHVAL